MRENNNAPGNRDIGELIALARANDGTAFESLLSLYDPMIKKEEDARQAALAGFYRAILTFDASQPGVAFGLYAKICVTHALISHAREAMRRAKDTAGNMEYDDYVKYHTDDTLDPAQQIIDEENIRSLQNLIRDNLSDYEY